MGSIRPLFTIAVLVVVGAYLYVKINEGPVRPHAGAHEAGNQIGDGVPPLAAAASGASLAQDSGAPAWPPAASTAPPANVNAPNIAPASLADAPSAGNRTPNSSTPAGAEMTKNGLPDVPPIPELPELPTTATVMPQAAQPSPPLPTELPKNIPEARYGDEAGPNLGPGTTQNAPNASPPLLAIPAASAAAGSTDVSSPPLTPGAATNPLPNSNPMNTLPIGPMDAPGAGGLTPPPLESLGPATTSLSSPPAAQPNSLRGPAPNAPATTQPPDRYAPSDNSASPPAPGAFGAAPTSLPSAPIGATFAASWPAIQAALDRGDLKQAHQLLSKWHGDESLAPADAQKVETLLGQLAGTVIYSTEHQLEPARVVKPGETLETIAKECNVPWQLLAKINGIASPDQLRPGQPLKVVRGPFTAVVALHRNELTLEVDGRYAGTFPISVPPGATVAEGQWLVDQKLGGPQNSVPSAAYAGPPATADRTIVLRNASIPGASPGGPTLTIASGPPAPGAGATAIRVAPQDAEDLSDILSIGSRVIVRR